MEVNIHGIEKIFLTIAIESMIRISLSYRKSLRGYRRGEKKKKSSSVQRFMEVKYGNKKVRITAKILR